MFDAVTNNLGWVAFGICAIGLIWGMRDVSRLSLTRIWAISGVCFAESIRRKVLWIAPLAMVAVLIVAGFVNAVDQLDNMRQLTKYCVFASGLVVTVAALILACTNLPKEIENRVIFTIVTKPTTRLEIVLGKVLGFARVSAAILIIMGLFTYIFLSMREKQLQHAAVLAMATLGDGDTHRATLQHYADEGLLHAQQFVQPNQIDLVTNPAQENDGGVRWIIGGIDQGIAVPFDVTPKLREELQSIADGNSSDLYIQTRIEARQRGLNASDMDELTEPHAGYTLNLPKVGDIPLPVSPTVNLEIMDDAAQTGIGGWQNPNDANLGLYKSKKIDPVMFPREAAKAVLSGHLSRFTVVIWGKTPGMEYGAKEQPTTASECAATLVDGNGALKYAPVGSDGAFLLPNFRGRPSQFGQQLRGGTTHWSPYGVARFINAHYTPANGKVPFLLRVQVEGAGGETDESQSTVLKVSVINRDNHFTRTAITEIKPDTRVQTYFDVPADLLKGGNFDIVFRCENNSHWISLPDSSLQMVAGDDSFALNLTKSLLVLWLMSVLVIAISIFSSTFLSWPIAVVFTLMLLLGHWGVVELSDAGGQLNTNMGASVVNDMFKSSGTVVDKTVKSAVDELTSMLNLVSRVLPDVSQFAAMESIERGVSMPMSTLRDSVLVLAEFGLPLTVLAYVIFKNKEVAP